MEKCNICINFATATTPALAQLEFSDLNFIFKPVFLRENCVVQVAWLDQRKSAK